MLNWAGLGRDIGSTGLPVEILLALLGLFLFLALVSAFRALSRRERSPFPVRSHALAWAIWPVALVGLVLVPKSWQRQAREERAAAPRQLVEKRVLPLSGLKIERRLTPPELSPRSVTLE